MVKISRLFTHFKAVAPGSSHSEQNCQDAAEAVLLEEGQNAGIALVADGHGSRRHFRSAAGAKLAVEIAKSAMIRFIQDTGGNLKKIGENLKPLKGHIIYRWREAVLQDIRSHPFSEEEIGICAEYTMNPGDENDQAAAYGSTLIGAALGEAFWFVIQIGDGECVVITDQGKAEIGIAEKDKRLAFGRTTSLCNADALESFRHNFGGVIAGITVASDGVADSFIRNDREDKYTDFNLKLLENFVKFPAAAEQELRDFLPKLSARGSKDDVALAGVFDLDLGKRILEIPPPPDDPAVYGDYCRSSGTAD
ncbi:MAG: protein phosphatase 2C domain-containing protein [Spirochaetaceae bacterium]|jgi:hypothetical protein|nr:protein phosphatase 2C domain-containing protein [Spirochaetaceae bacterium]